jgi:hypothetical protein
MTAKTAATIVEDAFNSSDGFGGGDGASVHDKGSKCKMIIAACGLPGSGKSFCLQRLAKGM